jgi:hypothetical protein
MTDATRPQNGELPPHANHAPAPDAGRTVLVGVLGGIISAAGYLVDEQRERLHRQVRGILESRINELRQNFNI